MPCRYPEESGIPACLAWGGGVSRLTPRGEAEGSGQEGSPGPHTRGGSPGPHLGGCVSQHALRQNPPPWTATAAGGTHPTGMHSCSGINQVVAQFSMSKYPKFMYRSLYLLEVSWR